MNRQGSTYTLFYSLLLILVVGVGLSLVYQALRPTQERNIADDTKKQILAAARISPQEGESISDLYAAHISESYIVNSEGERVDASGNALDVNVANQVKLPDNERELPVYVCSTPDGTKYILPVYGAGLWGPIWGYVAFDANGTTIYGAYFAHQGETPGLGAEIEKPAFSSQFDGKKIFNAEGVFTPILIVKQGQAPAGAEYVNAVSGGTITSQGVQKMLANSLQPYAAFLKNLSKTSQKDETE